jgi:hypothetical protein
MEDLLYAAGQEKETTDSVRGDIRSKMRLFARKTY